uniref:Uncharacterized protein n=1 Tax=Siphoviridae sp. ct3o911 TaxID=2827560 RepID=A0A8S5LJW4_9CAUD|nr:MAG TPA: hypothetical protein [Siphoviridae sp. ct3o911]
MCIYMQNDNYKLHSKRPMPFPHRPCNARQ